MRRRIIGIISNLAVAAASLAVTLLAVEHVVFGLLLKPDDVLPNVTINSVVRYLPETSAVFRHPDGSQTQVVINADGWNSTKPAYATERTPGRRRVAVIGDSYVHASFVDVGDGYPELIERGLAARGHDVEVFRFGMDGAPLTQYLHMLRREVVRYEPDVVVVGLIHNDFDESYRKLKTRTGSSFMKVSLDDGAEPEEIPPTDFRPGLADTLRNFATFRYLYYETNLYLRARSAVSRLFWGGEEDFAPEHISSAVDVRRIGDHVRNREVTRYVMREMRALAHRHGFVLVFAMDGVREAVYAGTDPGTTPVGALNRIAAEVADELSLVFIDLHRPFSDDYSTHGARFEFSYDWHWNRRGNRVVGEAIAEVVDAILVTSRKPPAVGRISSELDVAPPAGIAELGSSGG